MATENHSQVVEESFSHIEKGNDLFSQRAFDQALPEYEAALALLERERDDTDKGLQACLTNLASCYYFLQRYQEAISLFRRHLLAAEKTVGAGHRDSILTLFKMAQCYQKLDLITQAESLYSRALRLATGSIPEGDPLLSTLLEGYASMLERDQRNLAQARELKDQAKLNTERVLERSEINEHILAILKQTLPSEFEKDPSDLVPILNQQARQDSSEKVEKLRFLNEAPTANPTVEFFQDTIRTHPWAIPVSLVIVSLLICIYWLATYQAKKEQEIVSSEEAKLSFHSKEYESTDRLKRLVLTGADTAELEIDRHTQSVNYCFQIPGEDPIEPSQQPNTHLTYKLKYRNIIDNDGTILYNLDAPEVKVVAKMHMLAEEARKAFAASGEYPQDIEQLKSVNPDLVSENPLSGGVDIGPITYLGRADGEGALTTLEGMLDRGTTIENEPGMEPGSVHGYYMLAGDPESGIKAKYFFVRGVDSSGHFLTSSAHEKAFVISLKNGDDDTTEHIAQEMENANKNAPRAPIFVSILNQ